MSTDIQHSINCFDSDLIAIVIMLANTLWHLGSLAVQSWWYMLEAFVVMVICQDAILASLMFLKRPVSTDSCIATDIGTEIILASNQDPWPVLGVWQVVE